MDIYEEYVKLVGQDMVDKLKNEGRLMGNMMIRIKELNLLLQQKNKQIQELESEIVALKNVNSSI